MPGQPIQIGPFIGGLNTFSDPTAIADNQLTVCENFDLDLDGSLKSRPPFVDSGVPFPLDPTGGNMLVLGYYYSEAGAAYLIASDGASSTYYFTGSAWTLLTNTFAASAMVQFDNYAWLVAPISSTNPGGRWRPSDGFAADANMPKGDSIVGHKFRLWVVRGRDAPTQGTRLYYSEPLGVTPFWKASPDFIDVGSGDGQNIVRVVVYYNNLLIFRTGSVYSFQYTSNPDTGLVSLVVPGVGLSHKDALAAFENYVYFMFDDRAYEFSNSRVAPINVQVPFASGNRSGIYQPYAVSIFNQRVIFSYFDRMYVFGLRTRTWTTWASSVFGPIGKITILSEDAEFEKAVAHTSNAVPIGGSRTAPTLFITDTTSIGDAEEFTCSIQTKNYNYEASSIYKRLFSWGVDAAFRGTVRGVAVPITSNYAVSWGTLLSGGYTWGAILLAGHTWGQPLLDTLNVETQVDTSGTAVSRRFIKFLKSLRFRQIYYKVSFDTDGSTSSAPVRLFALMSYVKPKERVSKQVT